MKTSAFRALFCVVFAVSLFLAPSAHAMVMVKNYTRYTGEFVDPMTHAKEEAAIQAALGSEEDDERPWYEGWTSILNIFR